MKRDITANYIHYTNTGKPQSFRADIHIAEGCNFACIMCDNWKSTIRLNFSKEELHKMILTLKLKYNCTYIRFHGQEPTLYGELAEIIRFAHVCGIYTAIKTNGWLLNDIKIENLLSAGLNEIYLSIDGSTPEIHDAIRGKPGSFAKNIQVIEQARTIQPNIPIYINSVVMINNVHDLKNMVDFGVKHQINRVSFVFLNKKNKKEIHDLQLSKEDFFRFFHEDIPKIFDLAKAHGLDVDFSPFISTLIGTPPAHIAEELRENIEVYQDEINEMHAGNYGKYFYDRYGCFGPYDHASINHNGDMFGCCVVERSRNTAVGNVKETPLSHLWEGKKYESYRERANTACGYKDLCGSNFWTRKQLFLDIYDTPLYDKTQPTNYYRYLKERFQSKAPDTQIWKNMSTLLLYYYDSLPCYREFIEQSGINRNFLAQISSVSDFAKIPIISKDFLREHTSEIETFNQGKNSITQGITSGSTGKRFSFTHPLDFRRHVQQVALFSEMSGFTFGDSYFSVTPLNCNADMQDSRDSALPSYVKKIPIQIYDFGFDHSTAEKLRTLFETHQQTHYIYSEPTYLLYILLLAERYAIPLPHFKGIFLAYSPATRGIQHFLRQKFNCPISMTYGCSEVGPIGGSAGEAYKQISDTIYVEVIDGEIVVTDMSNLYTPFIRYKNGDMGSVESSGLKIHGRKKEYEHGYHWDTFDQTLFEVYPDIIMYQYTQETGEFLYSTFGKIKGEALLEYVKKHIPGVHQVIRIEKNDFFYTGPCSKFKTFIAGNEA